MARRTLGTRYGMRMLRRSGINRTPLEVHPRAAAHGRCVDHASPEAARRGRAAPHIPAGAGGAVAGGAWRPGAVDAGAEPGRAATGNARASARHGVRAAACRHPPGDHARAGYVRSGARAGTPTLRRASGAAACYGRAPAGRYGGRPPRASSSHPTGRSAKACPSPGGEAGSPGRTAPRPATIRAARIAPPRPTRPRPGLERGTDCTSADRPACRGHFGRQRVLALGLAGLVAAAETLPGRRSAPHGRGAGHAPDHCRQQW